MCGILGYYCFGEKRPDKEDFSNMLVECSTRGTDATGLAWIEEKNGTHNLRVVKGALEAEDFIETKPYKAIKLPKCLIAHTRHGTQGTEKENVNNHPIYDKGLAITHNGSIRNDFSVFKQKNYKRDGKVDSEAILRAIQEKLPQGIDKAVKNTSILTGTFACAMISRNFPDKLVLFKHNNPIMLAYDKKTDIFWYASTKDIIKAGFFEEHRGIYFPTSRSLFFGELEDETSIIIGRKGRENYYEFYDEKKNITWQNPSMTNYSDDDNKTGKRFYCSACGSQRNEIYKSDQFDTYNRPICWQCWLAQKEGFSDRLDNRYINFSETRKLSLASNFNRGSNRGCGYYGYY